MIMFTCQTHQEEKIFSILEQLYYIMLNKAWQEGKKYHNICKAECIWLSVVLQNSRSFWGLIVCLFCSSIENKIFG